MRFRLQEKADSLFQEGSYDEALRLYKKIRTPEAALAVVRCLYELGRYEEAQKAVGLCALLMENDPRVLELHEKLKPHVADLDRRPTIQINSPFLGKMLAGMFRSTVQQQYPQELPIVRESPKSKIPSIIFACLGTIFFLIWSGVLLKTASEGKIQDAIGGAVTGGLFFIIGGVILWAAGTWKVMTISEAGVSVQRSFFGLPLRGCDLPYGEFEGLKNELIVTRSSGGKERSGHTTYTYLVRLVHRDLKLCMTLASESSSTASESIQANFRSLTEHYARLLNVPMLQRMMGKPFKRNAEDLDKNIWDLADEGKIRPDESVLAHKPRNVEIQDTPEATRIFLAPTIGAFVARGICRFLWLVVAGALIAGIFVVEGDAKPILIFGTFMFAMFMLPFWLNSISWSRGYIVELGADAIRFAELKGDRRIRERELAPYDIETIDFGRSMVRLEQDEGPEIKTKKLAKGCAEWLANYILASYASEQASA